MFVEGFKLMSFYHSLVNCDLVKFYYHPQLQAAFNYISIRGNGEGYLMSLLVSSLLAHSCWLSQATFGFSLLDEIVIGY